MAPRWWPRRRAICAPNAASSSASSPAARSVRSVQTIADRLAPASLGAIGNWGERPGGQEVLQRQVVVRPVVGDRAYHPGLVVGMPGDRDAGVAPQPAVAALGGHHQAGGDGRAARDMDRGAGLRAGHLRLGRGEHVDRRVRRQRGVDRPAQRPRLDHPAERGAVASIGQLRHGEMQVHARCWLADAPVRHADVVDRAGSAQAGIVG